MPEDCHNCVGWGGVGWGACTHLHTEARSWCQVSFATIPTSFSQPGSRLTSSSVSQRSPKILMPPPPLCWDGRVYVAIPGVPYVQGLKLKSPSLCSWHFPDGAISSALLYLSLFLILGQPVPTQPGTALSTYL